VDWLAKADILGLGFVRKRYWFETVLLSIKREWEKKLPD
jgi:hypothetical protein